MEMDSFWLFPVLLYILLAYVWARVWQKKLSDLGSWTKTVFLQFLACFFFVGVAVLFWQKPIFDQTFATIVVIGFVNGLAAYCSWRAIAISLSRNSLFTFLDDVIAIFLSYLILGQTKLLTQTIIIGTALSFLAVILYTYHSYPKAQDKERGKTGLTPAFFLYVAGYSIGWGIVVFLFGYYSLERIGVLRILFPWYAGAVIAAAILWASVRENQEGKAPLPLTLPVITERFLFGGLIALCLAVEYWALQTPLSIVQPIFLVSEFIIPTILGIMWFREKGLDSREQICFALGIAGSLLIVFGYR